MNLLLINEDETEINVLRCQKEPVPRLRSGHSVVSESGGRGSDFFLTEGRMEGTQAEKAASGK